MVARKIFTLIIAFASIASLLLWHSASYAQTATAVAAPNEIAATEAIRNARLAEPLIATAPTTAQEDQELAQALETFSRRAQPDDLSALTAYLSKYPHSGWAPAISANLGLSYLHQGYYSKAIDAWQRAWREGKNATAPDAKAVVDRAVGELALTYASLGKIPELKALFSDIGSRPIAGSATELIQTARETLTVSEKDPQHLFNCGPLALRALMLLKGASANEVSSLAWYKAGVNGTSLSEVAGLADKAKFKYRLVYRSAGQPVPVPSVAHMKVGHFATIVGENHGRYLVQDSAFSNQTLVMPQEALDGEGSGYFLVPADMPQKPGWRAVPSTEAGRIWGKGNTNGLEPDAAATDISANPDNNCPLCGYNIKESSVAVSLADTPVGYAPPIGPPVKTRITYNQREDSQPANFSFYNVGQKWTLNWISYVTDDPSNVGLNVTRFPAGGGSFQYSGYNSATGQFSAQTNDGSILVRTSASPITYQHRLGDGSIEIYSQSDGSASYPRKIFLTQIVDPQGNALTLNYDGQLRLTSITDATGRQTTFSYGIATRPLQVTQITDPFGRSAVLTYNANGTLASITDILGLKSSFGYDANQLVNSLTTPYGTTTFAYTAPGTSAPPRFVQVTDPLGYSEREEWLEPSPTPTSDPAATVPTGMATFNLYLEWRNSFHWDKNAYVVAGCTPTGGCDYTKARMRHFTHWATNSSLKATALESEKYPLENRIWYDLPGQTSTLYSGTYMQPSAIGRVLDDGTTQLRKFSYDTAGYFNLTQSIDPLGRTTNFAYSNQIDLVAVNQVTAAGAQTIAQYIYNYHHRPLIYLDAAGQMTSFAYNAAGQLTSTTNPLGQTTSYQYDTAHNLSTVTNANNAPAATYTYDSFARVRTFTDSEGWTVTYDYDTADRVTKVTYPDGTTDTYTYDKLDLVSYQDRQLRTWTYTYDANRRQTSVTDPSGKTTQYGYNNAGLLTSLTDPKTNVTNWTYDVQGRLTGKQYPDTSTVTYTYENTTSRLKSVKDALNQVKTYAYAKDDLPTGITYTGAVNPTPNVSFTYDPFFPRLASMTDGTGTTPYTYVSIGSLGALQLQQESSPLTNSAIAYAYDELGRLASRTVSGAGAETFHYDAIGRLITHASDLGAFTLGYLGQTGQLASRTLASSTLATTWSYLPNAGDRRLSGISNTGLTAGQFSNYTYTTTPENQTTGITESSDASAVYPVAGTQTATYNNLNQLTNLSGQALTFDANGNLTSDGQRNYTWDAENRLVGISYPGVSGKATAFTYDGLDRRVSIASTPAGGGSATTTSYLWCGSDICQARNASNTPIKGYYDEGEFMPGSPGQPYYYGIDQIGSVRRAFASASSAPAYSYDPYGAPLQSTSPATDFVYAGMFYNADSGLYLTRYRAYDSVVGRWLSRDPLGEATTSPMGNLYTYVGGRPTNTTDISGLVASSPAQAGPSSGGQSCSDGGSSAGPQLAQLLGPPPVFFGRPPVVLPRPVTPLEELPPGSSGGLGAERSFPRSYNKQQPEGTPCLYCGEPTTKEPGPNQLQGDHIVPKSQGGNNTPENYAPSCRTCNLQKGPRTPKEWYNKLGPGGEG